MKKILCLNSGGFDSVVMLHYIRENFPNAEIDTLFFRWGQSCLEAEEKCAVDSTTKVLGKPPIIMGVPYKDIWGDVNMTDEDEYIPMRNLVFLSMAIAYARKHGYDTIAMAYIFTVVYQYEDCTEEFMDNISYLIKPLDMGFYTPFHHMTKEGLIDYAKKYGVTQNDFFSCNVPVRENGVVKPCNKCETCLLLNELYEN